MQNFLAVGGGGVGSSVYLKKTTTKIKVLSSVLGQAFLQTFVT